MTQEKLEKVHDDLEKSLERKKEEKDIEKRLIYSQDRKPTEPPKKPESTPPPKKKSSKKLPKIDKEGNVLIDAFLWYLAVCLMLVAYLLPHIGGWTLFGLCVSLLWTVYGGWIKRTAEIKWKKLWKKFEEVRRKRAEDEHTIIRLNSKIKGLQEELVKSKQRVDDSYVIETKLIKNIEELSAIITKKVT